MTFAAKNLATYQAKRDFTKTDEPSGKAKVAASKELRFVTQKHDATRLHYDFRLELDGVFSGISASSRVFVLNGETKTWSSRIKNSIIAHQISRSRRSGQPG